MNCEQYNALMEDIKKLPEQYFSDAVQNCEYEVSNEDGTKNAVVIFTRNDLSNRDYTKHFVYDCLSTISHWGKLKRAISACLQDTSMDYGEYVLLNKREHTFENYLKKHHKYETCHVDGLIDGTVMRYTIIEPYDD